MAGLCSRRVSYRHAGLRHQTCIVHGQRDLEDVLIGLACVVTIHVRVPVGSVARMAQLVHERKRSPLGETDGNCLSDLLHP